MMDYDKTLIVLDNFYHSCFAFWLGNGNDEIAAHHLAMKDMERAKWNPFSPNGEELHPEAKAKFMEMYKEYEGACEE